MMKSIFVNAKFGWIQTDRCHILDDGIEKQTKTGDKMVKNTHYYGNTVLTQIK